MYSLRNLGYGGRALASFAEAFVGGKLRFFTPVLGTLTAEDQNRRLRPLRLADAVEQLLQEFHLNDLQQVESISPNQVFIEAVETADSAAFIFSVASLIFLSACSVNCFTISIISLIPEDSIVVVFSIYLATALLLIRIELNCFF